MTLKLDAPPLHPSYVSAAPSHQFSALLQGRGKPPLLYSTVRAYVPLISALVLSQGVPICQPSAENAPLPQFSAYFLQKYGPLIQPL